MGGMDGPVRTQLMEIDMETLDESGQHRMMTT